MRHSETFLNLKRKTLTNMTVRDKCIAEIQTARVWGFEPQNTNMHANHGSRENSA